MNIFLSIASYCDPVLGFTLARALATARWPERLHFGVVDIVRGRDNSWYVLEVNTAPGISFTRMV